MGAVAVKRELHDAVLDSVPGGIELFHGYTYSGHPLASAAGLATLDLYARDGLFDRANELAAYWEDAAHSLKGARHVIDIRAIGLVAGIELDRKSVVEGKRWSVRVDPGGVRIIKKKTHVKISLCVYDLI